MSRAGLPVRRLSRSRSQVWSCSILPSKVFLFVPVGSIRRPSTMRSRTRTVRSHCSDTRSIEVVYSLGWDCRHHLWRLACLLHRIPSVWLCAERFWNGSPFFSFFFFLLICWTDVVWLEFVRLNTVTSPTSPVVWSTFCLEGVACPPFRFCRWLMGFLLDPIGLLPLLDLFYWLSIRARWGLTHRRRGVSPLLLWWFVPPPLPAPDLFPRWFL